MSFKKIFRLCIIGIIFLAFSLFSFIRYQAFHTSAESAPVPVFLNQQRTVIKDISDKDIASKEFFKIYPDISSPVFIDSVKMERIREQIKRKEEPTYSEWLKLLSSANQKKNYKPNAPSSFYVPYVYSNPEGHWRGKNPLVKDANSAYELALAYQVTGNEKYAIRAARILDNWSHTTKTFKKSDDTPLVVSINFPSMIIAASLIEDSPNWTRDNQADFKEFISKKVLPMNTMNRENNWGNWGLLLGISSAAYLDDQKLFSASINRWKYFIEHQMNTKGHLYLEVTRNYGKGNYGIWYSHFSLQPQTIAAEIAKVNGVYLFTYTTPSGKSLKKAFSTIVSWTEKPETFPYYNGDINELWHVRKKLNETAINGDESASIGYFEILSIYYNNKKAQKLLHVERPLTSSHAVPYLTFTHGGVTH
ncbi:alginate lyase family protein [Mesobacillus sp. AQ2]|uniref:alginate lyase family protein n=1 Tax=Mesobacillus sp. AQ2 TaxID=3043332 RepID=UPI0024C187F0|nr:alginate lyase family protein [Mesobacillus sp. AQ2]WHX40260.1 alginate lyase family protein [Mesobacillus sp. AQ2]